MNITKSSTVTVDGSTTRDTPSTCPGALNRGWAEQHPCWCSNSTNRRCVVFLFKLLFVTRTCACRPFSFCTKTLRSVDPKKVIVDPYF